MSTSKEKRRAAWRLARFWAKVRKTPTCWVWTGSQRGPTKIKYGSCWWNGKLQGAHRVSWQINRGEIPPRLCVLHKCDFPLCVKPNHLFIGTKQDNAIDMFRKKRVSRAGENNGRSKLTWKQVRQIRKRYANGETQPALGREFGVIQPTIGFIVRGEHWKE